MLDLTKPVRTKGGNKVRILATDVSGKYPIVAVVENGDPDGIGDPETVETYMRNGQYSDAGESTLDLENIDGA